MRTLDELKKELMAKAAPNFKGTFEVLLGFLEHDAGAKMVSDLCKSYAMQSKINWIGVDESLPLNKSYVLGFNTTRGTDIYEYYSNNFFIGINRFFDLTHWAELGEPEK